MLNILGYALSAKALETIMKRYSRAMDDGRILIAFDDFVSMSVRLRAYTGKYEHFHFHYLQLLVLSRSLDKYLSRLIGSVQ